jgi:hypothetical protein
MTGSFFIWICGILAYPLYKPPDIIPLRLKKCWGEGEVEEYQIIQNILLQDILLSRVVV